MANCALEKADVLTLELARSLFSYDPLTGELRWKRPPRRGVSAEPAGCRNSDGYLIVGYKGREYLGIHIIWMLMTGEWPRHIVDHKNRIKADDRWENLRAATHSENNRNANLRKDNKTGVRGVVVPPRSRKFEARITVDGRQIGLGRFDFLEQAAQARRSAEIKYFGEFSPLHGGVNG